MNDLLTIVIPSIDQKIYFKSYKNLSGKYKIIIIENSYDKTLKL